MSPKASNNRDGVDFATHNRFSIVQPSAAHRSRKSFRLNRWMFGVSYQWCGSARVTGIAPRTASDTRFPACPKLGNATIARGATRRISRNTSRGRFISCSVRFSTA